MGNPFEDLRQAVVVRPMNSPGPQGAAAPHMKIKYSADGVTWHNDPVETDKYLSFSTDNGITWSDAIYFNNLSETLEWVEKARQWAENPENDEVEPGQYSALHHALKAKKSEITAGEYAIDAAGSAVEAFGAAAPAWDSTTIYNYNDVVSFNNGHTYRCIGTNIIGADHAPNINGVDNEAEWTRITVAPDGYFEVDENGDLMPMLAPITSEIFMLDENGDIMYQEDINLESGMGGGSQGKIEFVDSIAEFRLSSFPSVIENVYVNGYYGAGTPGGGMFYRDPNSLEADNSGTIIVDANGVRWKRANVYEEYYASWFGISPNISNNSPLIQNAFNAIPHGSILIFGPGVYLCQEPIIYPYDYSRPPFGFGTDSYGQAHITIQGATKMPSYQWSANDETIFEYSGPNPDVLTPFFDFRCTNANGEKQNFKGSIRNIVIRGQDNRNRRNIVGLWFDMCAGMELDSVHVMAAKRGIQIDGHYYYSKFKDMLCMFCDYGFVSNGVPNGVAFDDCNFRYCTIGFADNKGHTGIYFNNCYFECNDTAIKSLMGLTLHINQCYFEGHTNYIIDIFGSSDAVSLLVLENSFFHIYNQSSIAENKAVIKQAIDANHSISYVIQNNYMDNYANMIDYFIYAESGNLTIKAENNKLMSISYDFPMCSKVPTETSYFNNDFNNQ